MQGDFQQNDWGPHLIGELERLLEIAVSEDTETIGDLTSRILISENAVGSASLRVRENGVVAGVQAVPTVLGAVDKTLSWEPAVSDGATLAKGDLVGVLRGPARSLLTVERLVLNLLGRLSGVATLTKHYVDTIAGTNALIYDTRKTTLGWRRLEKYAVRCGGGRNHRTGLFDAVLIKDNHLAFGATEHDGGFSPAQAVVRAKEFLRQRAKTDFSPSYHGALYVKDSLMHDEKIPIVEVEVDTLKQLEEVLAVRPDIVLLDNMSPAMLVHAVKMRNERQPEVELEASGGITLETVLAVARTGVERISVGALTHSALSLDLGLDWGIF